MSLTFIIWSVMGILITIGVYAWSPLAAGVFIALWCLSRKGQS